MTATNMAVYMAERRKSRRAQLITMSGGKCIKCGSTDDLNFDHKEPKGRSFRLTGKTLDGSWNTILEEWRKCQLLCRVCHLIKTRENGENNKEPWNKGISKYGSILPEHGCETAYAHGCRCPECSRARYEAKVRRGELSGKRGPRGSNTPKGTIRHGTRAGYVAEKRLGIETCEECRKANAEATRINRQKKSLVCGETVS